MKLAQLLKVLFALLPAWIGVASAQTPVTVPDKLKPPVNETLALALPAKGVQIYQCRQKKETPNQFEWVFLEPEASLFDDKGRRIGKHYAGPTWESIDGSKVIGELQERADAPDPNAIPWLLLKAKATEGKGVFSNIKSIQRVSTEGGKAPPEACEQKRMGVKARRKYKAVYYFYVAKP